VLGKIYFVKIFPMVFFLLSGKCSVLVMERFRNIDKNTSNKAEYNLN
jgi:hypothetical protein